MEKNAVSTSILSADFLNLGRDIEMINKSETDFIHCDIMDGVFVPNLSFGLPVIQQIHKIAKKPLDVHLMIVHPEKYIQAFKNAGASLLTVQYEVCPHLHRTIQLIKKAGMKAGVALNPHTPVSLLEDIICDVDLVLIMSVNPGFGGQKFIENTYSKVKRLKELILSKKSKSLIEIDGGVNFDTGKKLYRAGSDILVSGSFIFNSEDPQDTIHHLKEVY
ncbi:MAG: ribulose-phosphate 3-epimerase [Prolixibacteraceae bacterium]|nr:ribulose-phosphate 3-epimerase [Prolixibacteraceae bacterium]